MTRFAIPAACLLFTALVLAGCSESPQEQYRDAVDAIAEAQQDVSEQQTEVNQLRKKLDDLKKQSNEAVAELQDKRDDLDQARQLASQRATDQVLFQVIQNKLLDDDRFQQAAISVAVDNGVVTLTGTVPDKKTGEAARKVAASQPGVQDVVLKLDVEGTEKH